MIEPLLRGSIEQQRFLVPISLIFCFWQTLRILKTVDLVGKCFLFNKKATEIDRSTEENCQIFHRLGQNVLETYHFCCFRKIVATKKIRFELTEKRRRRLKTEAYQKVRFLRHKKRTQDKAYQTSK